MSTIEISKKGIITVENQVENLMERFSDVQSDLAEAMEASEKIENANFKTGVWSNITGKTDKQITSQVRAIGSNLHNTQKIVLFLLEISNAKNEVLRGFHSSLVDKLVKLENQSSDLNNDLSVSQTNEIKIVRKIKEEVESKLGMEKKLILTPSS